MRPTTNVEISVSSEFHEFIPAAILRLKYIYPEFDFEHSAIGVKLSSVGEVDIQQLEREVCYQVYREKIFQQTLPMRRDLYQMLAV